MSNELDAPKVEVTKFNFEISTPSSTNKNAKKGQLVHGWFKPGELNYFSLGTHEVKKDGGQANFTIEKNHEKLKGQKTVAFRYDLENADGSERHKSTAVTVANPGS
jgi:hypothetical protein